MIRAELNQSILRGGQRLPRRDLERALAMCSDVLSRVSPPQRGGVKRGWTELSVAFVSERDMRRLNKQWRGKDRVTDVLSFSPSYELRTTSYPEILISYDQAKRQAAELGHSTRDEIVFLIVHGVLHVFGYDHETPADAKRMFPLQTKILNRLGIDPRL